MIVPKSSGREVALIVKLRVVSVIQHEEPFLFNVGERRTSSIVSADEPSMLAREMKELCALEVCVRSIHPEDSPEGR